MRAFEPPSDPHQQKHGPNGYTDYMSYRPWLRDEFAFRCVYCLFREQWGRVRAEFELDHFRPQAKDPGLETVYDNLVYSCRVCNVLKSDRDVPDPCSAFIASAVRINPDGSMEGRSDDARKLIRILGLDSDRYRQWRMMWIRVIELAEAYDVDLYTLLMGFPEDLPELSRLKPPAHSRPEGIEQSFFRQRERGELAQTY